jgi:hypothetical protein
MRKYINMVESIADDFALNEEIERLLQPFSSEDRVLLRDGLECLKNAGPGGTAIAGWVTCMTAIHASIDGSKLREIFKVMMETFPNLVQRAYENNYVWHPTARDNDNEVDMSNPLVQLAGAQIQYTGQILNLMREHGRFSIRDIVTSFAAVSGLPAQMATMLVQHVADSNTAAIKPDGAGMYHWEEGPKAKTPNEHMALWRDLASRGGKDL